MRINDYSEIQHLSLGDKLIIEADDGTKKIDGSNISLTLDISVLHKNIIRGKNLGNTYTSEQKQAIADGTFDDLYLGDYWEKDGIKWQIVDINYWSDKPNHLVIMPHKSLDRLQYDNRSGTAPQWAGYSKSTVRVAGINQKATPAVIDMFGSLDNIMNQRLCLTITANADGSNKSTFEWKDDCKIELPTCSQILGYSASTMLGGVQFQNLPQFSYFTRNNYWTNEGEQNETDWFWVQDIYDATTAIYLMHGRGFGTLATNERFLRPYFCLF